MTAEAIIGEEGQLLYDGVGVGVGTWAELDAVIDVTGNAERAAAEIKDRSLDDVLVLPGKRTISVEGNINYKPGDAGFEAMRDAFLNKRNIGIAVMTGPIATVGSEGWQFDAQVVSFGRGEPLEEGMQVPFTLRPSAQANSDSSAPTTPIYVEVTV